MTPDVAPGDPVCEYLEWDSQFFDVRIARVTGRTLTPATAAAVRDWCVGRQVECLYLLVDASDPPAARTAEENGFHFVDVRVTLERHGVPQAPTRPFEGTLRPCRPGDLPALRSMARTGFRQTRYYADPRFPEAKADALYETWIDKSCHGYADAVLVAEDRAAPVGYVTCHLRGEGTGQIGLLGVRKDCQSRGLGRALTTAAVEWFAGRGAGGVRVVTQGRNRGALRAYGQCGFLVDTIEIWYHRWFERAHSR